jgi:hypothetical protein
MADVSSLGQYKVVVTADYSQLQANFKAMADFVTNTTKSMTDSVNKSMSGMNAAMLNQLQSTVEQLKRSFEGLGEAPKKAGDGFKTYAQQVNAAERETQKAFQKLQDLQNKLQVVQSTPAKSSSDYLYRQNEEQKIEAAIRAQQAEYDRLRQKLLQLKAAQEQYKNSVNQTEIAAKQANQALAQSAKDQQNLMRQNARLLQGEMRSRQQAANEQSKANAQQARAQAQNARQQQQLANAQSRRIAQLQTQYRVAYEEANKYLQTHAKMSEAVFIRLQGRLTAIGAQIRELRATPMFANPLGNMNYADYEKQFSKWSDMMQSLKHHLTWMASAMAIGTAFAIPSKTISTIVDVEKHMAAMRQVNHDVNANQVVLNRTAQEFIGIAQQYGHSVDEIIKSGTLWGRQYKDLQDVMQLTNLSAKLAVADNMDVGLANRAVESVINGYQKQGEAVKFANHVVDSWTKIAHNAQSSATDLAEALMRTGAAAKAVGVDFDTTNALASAMIKSTGRSGAEVGRQKLAA